jgi:regulator of sirC expression with transglutaminase-like and TPR domain
LPANNLPYRSQFREITSLPEDELDLGRAALLIAVTEYPDLDIDKEVGLLDSLASAAATRLGSETDNLHSVNVISSYLFDEVGFRGNEQDYYHPNNSYLNKVLECRLGIPITLSLVFIEVAKRLNVSMTSIGMPGHLLIRHTDISDIYIDPFHGGILLSESECIERMNRITGGRLKWEPKYLEPLGKHEFLSRMLRNLKSIYLKDNSYKKAHIIMDQLLEIDPGSMMERRDRGIVNFQLGNYPDALQDLEIYLESGVSGSEVSSVTKLIWKLRDLLSN